MQKSNSEQEGWTICRISSLGVIKMNCFVREIFRSQTSFSADCKKQKQLFLRRFSEWRTLPLALPYVFLSTFTCGSSSFAAIIHSCMNSFCSSPPRNSIWGLWTVVLEYNILCILRSHDYYFYPSLRKSILRSTSPFPTVLLSLPLNAAACCAAFASGKNDGIETSRAEAWRRWTLPATGGDTQTGALPVGYRKWSVDLDGFSHSKWWFSIVKCCLV